MDEKIEWNKRVDHPLQAWEWGEFRAKTGVKVVREDGIQVTIHKIPYTKWNIGYFPKGGVLDNKNVTTLKKISRAYNCVLIKCEPKVEATERNEKWKAELRKLGFVVGRPLFTKYNFVLDVRPSEEELLSRMKQKTRYNIKVATKRGVVVELSDKPEDFERYLQLTKETTERQGFYAHGEKYHRLMWQTLSGENDKSGNRLSAHLLSAKYQGEVITTWVLFKFKDTLYYPYGASTREHREVMANNLVMWEAIKLAKAWGLSYLDMWGALGPTPDTQDPWYGFHSFKQGYGGRHVEYVGTWDYVAMPLLYRIYTMLDNFRWMWLKATKKGR